MAITPPCKSCRCKCLIVSLRCILEADNQLNQSLDLEKIKAALDKAQRLWIIPLIGNTCFNELCAALDDFQKNGTVIPVIWEDFTEEAIPFLAAATEYLYVSKHARAPLKKDGLIFSEDFKVTAFNDYMILLKANVELEYDLLKKWVTKNKANYPCLPVEEESLCEDTATESYSLFETTSGNNRFDFHQHPDRDKLYDFPSRRLRPYPPKNT